MNKMPDNIPFEIQVEIIKWLPVKSLVVFRLVSKAWKSIIDSPLFITDHTNLRRHHRLLIRYIDETDRKFSPDINYVSVKDNNGTISQHEFDTVGNVPVSLKLLKKLELVGTSKGLLCLVGERYSGKNDYDYKQTAVIWNPSLEKYITINVHYAYVLGFGVRPDNCDPMIVRIRILGRAWLTVYTLSSRVWRLPHGKLLSRSISFSYLSPATTDNRCIYWKADEGSINLVVAFDMVSEDFTEIHLPYSVAHRESYDFSISKIKESLALLEFYDGGEKELYGVWMMVEDGVSKSFTKLFTISRPDASFWTTLLGFRMNGQPIMDTTTDKSGVSTLEVYEPLTGAIKNLGINGKDGSFFCCPYTETLILLDQLDGSNL